MSKIKTAVGLLCSNRGEFTANCLQKVNCLFNDRIYLKLLFRCKMGYPLNIDCPVTFNEKLQWLKLYNRDPKYTQMVDKLTVKDYVAKKIGNEYIIPTLSAWDEPEDIDWDSLPQQFVLKTTHGGGSSGVIVCKDKSILDKDEAIEKLKVSMRQDIYGALREWPYKNIRKRVFAEKYMSDDSGDLMDYKYFCFDGVMKSLLLITDRFKEDAETCFDFYDRDFVHQNITTGPPMSSKELLKPESLDEMIGLAERLSKGIPFVRVDLYQIRGKVYFGEFTFYPVSGMIHFNPEEWDCKFGEWLKLPNQRIG